MCQNNVYIYVYKYLSSLFAVSVSRKVLESVEPPLTQLRLKNVPNELGSFGFHSIAGGKLFFYLFVFPGTNSAQTLHEINIYSVLDFSLSVVMQSPHYFSAGNKSKFLIERKRKKIAPELM